MATLGSLGIEDTEQLLAIAAIPEVREELQVVLSLKDQDLQSLLDQAQAALPAERAALVSAPAPTEFGLGVLVPTAEMMAAAEATAAPLPARAVALPPSVNLIPHVAHSQSGIARDLCLPPRSRR